MAKHRTELKNEHIWQYDDLDSKNVSILHIDRERIQNIYQFKSQLNEIGDRSGCIIKAHGSENQLKGVVWIRVHSKSADLRRDAINLINELNGNACKEIIIPKLPQNEIKILDDANENLVTTDEHDSNSSVSSLSHLSMGNNSDKTKSLSSRRPLIRSSTENSISCLANVNNSAPFGSHLVPLTIHDKLDEENDEFAHIDEKTNSTLSSASFSSMEINDLDRMANKRDQAGSSQQNTPSSKKYVYSLDFLLSRAEADSSRTMPSNWKELSAMYPNICFSGKVISYFNPQKYDEHWVRVQNQNPDWHHPIAWVQRSLKPAGTRQFRIRNSQTDECINQRLNYFDHHNNNYQNFRKFDANNPNGASNYRQPLSQQFRIQQQQQFFKSDANSNRFQNGNANYVSNGRRFFNGGNGYGERRQSSFGVSSKLQQPRVYE